MATYAIGDIQGCYDTLQSLLQRVRFQAGSDKLWLVGDLVNRGPKSLEVLRWARDSGTSVVPVLGNHDLHLLTCAHGIAEPRAGDTLTEVLQAPDRGALLDWLSHQPFLYLEAGFGLVHAGLLPSWTTEEAHRWAQRASESLVASPREFLQYLRSPERDSGDGLKQAVSALTRLRTCSPEGQMHPFDQAPEQAPPGFYPWFRLPNRRSVDTTWVFGHWAALGLDLGERWIATDTGCVWGRHLTAVRLEDRAVFQVPALEKASSNRFS